MYIYNNNSNNNNNIPPKNGKNKSCKILIEVYQNGGKLL